MTGTTDAFSRNTSPSKYELVLDQTITAESGATLYRIRALRDLPGVKAGDLGGYVQSEINLSHHGDCWVYNNAQVRDNALVADNAKIYANGLVKGNCVVRDNAWVGKGGLVSHDSVVCGTTWVRERNRHVFKGPVVSIVDGKIWDRGGIESDTHLDVGPVGLTRKPA